MDREFEKTLRNFVYENYIEGINDSNTNIHENSIKSKDNYINEIQKYMDEEVDFKKKIIKKAKELIDNDKEAEGKCKSLINKLFKMNYITKNSLDIISCLLDYIKEKIFDKYLNHIFTVLEDNNIFTTLLEIKNYKHKILEERIIDQLKDNFLNIITMEKKNYMPKFLFEYQIPGFFNFYENLSDYIKKTIAIEYFNNEKKLREYPGKENEKQKIKIIEFYEKEEDLLSLVYDEIGQDKIVFDIIKKISPDLIFKDYITYYLYSYIIDDYKSDINNKLIELLLKLKFNENNQMIKNNKKHYIKILLIKIIWIESNVNYILSILKLFYYAKKLFKDENILYNKMEEIIYNKSGSLKYITNERNPIHKKEVNECYYLILASLCLSVTSDDMQLTELLKEERKAEINHYCKALKNMNNILEILNSDLKLYLNEKYIFDELIEVIDLQNLKEINLEKIVEIRKNLRENAFIIQNNKTDMIKELIENFKKIYNSFISKEIKKEKNKKYYAL